MATKARFYETFQLMLNSLDTENIISSSEFDNLGKAFGLVWRNRKKSFYLTQRAIEKAQST